MKAPLAVAVGLLLACACATTRSYDVEVGMTNLMPERSSCIATASNATCNYDAECCSGRCTGEGGTCQ